KEKEILKYIENITNDINSFNKNEECKYFIALSIGVYKIDDPNLPLVSIQDRANVARKNNKGNIGNHPLYTCVFYSDLERLKMIKEKEMENRMEEALNNNEFIVYLQPKISLKDNTIVGAEALVRWQDPNKGLIPPDEFIPFFEKNGFITKECADYLINAVKEHKNILVTGGTGTGKTTFLNTLLKCVELYTPYDRTVILEDLSELQSNINDCLRMQTRVDADPNKSVTMQTLIWLSMRNSPNRIIVGEVRDGSAYDLLKGWNTGHPGGFGTTHANGALEGLDRLESLIYENPTAKGNFRQLLGQAVNVIVDIGRIDIPNGPSKRFIRDIIEVNGFNRHTESYDTSIIYHKEGSDI
ncbi:MAG: ATPase, T2SS/T4P/T4SS family, partial [Veillonella dispar]|nr:ATPase, T2SS/T4P/T4SS family [Veillonella dispar]